MTLTQKSVERAERGGYIFIGTSFHRALCLQGQFHSFMLFVVFSDHDGVKLDLPGYPLLWCDADDDTKLYFNGEEKLENREFCNWSFGESINLMG